MMIIGTVNQPSSLTLRICQKLCIYTMIPEDSSITKWLYLKINVCNKWCIHLDWIVSNMLLVSDYFCISNKSQEIWNQMLVNPYNIRVYITLLDVTSLMYLWQVLGFNIDMYEYLNEIKLCVRLTSDSYCLNYVL